MPNTREKLIELINEKQDFGAEQHPNMAHEILMLDNDVLADHLIANGVTVQEWIPVTERLPEKDGYYLVAKKIFNNSIMQEVLSFVKDGRKVDKYDFHRGWKNVWYLYDSEWGHLTIDTVTHWMPLPEPPKGE